MSRDPISTGSAARRPRRARAGRAFRWLGLLPPMALALAVAGRPATPTARDEQSLRQAARLRGEALAAMEDGNYGLATERLANLADILPDNVLPPINLAICHLRLNRPEAARREIDRARALAPDNPQMLYTLARILERQPEYRDDWEDVVERFARGHPRDPRPHYLRAQRAADEGDWTTAVAAYQQAVRRDSENLVLLSELLVAAAESGDASASLDALDAVEDRLNGFEGSLSDFAERLRESAEEGPAEALRPPALVLRNLLRPTDLYQLGLIPLTGGRQPGGQMFPQLDFEPPLPKSIQGGQDIDLAFLDASAAWDPQGSLALGELLLSAPEERRDRLMILGPDSARLMQVEAGRVATQRLDLTAAADHAFLHDVDQDKLSDLAIAGPDGRVRLFRGLPQGGFATGTVVAEAEPTTAITGLFPLDIDHDGDLDLFATRRGRADLYLQNNGDATWRERATELGIGGGDGDTAAAVSADFDDDGVLDLVTIHPDGPVRLYRNRLAGPLTEVAGAWPAATPPAPLTGGGAADFDGDGLFDLALWGEAGGGIFRNSGGDFAAQALPLLPSGGWRAVAIADFDNDGDPDLVVAVEPSRELVLLRNRRSDFAVEPLGRAPAPTRQLVAGDWDDDGDLDLALRVEGGEVRLWRNDGGDRNQWLRLRLQGLYDNNSKNHTQGLFTRIEVRIGDDLQTLLGSGGVNHLGLGAARQADIIRVVWTNGLAQTWLQVGANRTLVEEQILKGSCPFLYAWNGESFQFVTDLMWRSPLGMILADGSAAPHQSARDWVLLPGERLAPSGGELWLQVTEELWETVYLDRFQLVAVDHPETAELVIDEAFRPPPHPRRPPAHWIGRRLAPSRARDHRDRDVLAEVLARDDRYVGDLPLDRYQGVTRGHHLEVTFEQVPAGQRLRLLLWGWIFPTDTTINFALAQDGGRDSRPPSLELLGPDGRWRTLEPFIGFPNGKRKAVVVELGGKLPAGTVTLRIPTTLQIYWDAVALAVGEPRPASRWTTLEPTAADLHYRGYSRLYRESSDGPHLFDYRQVSIEPRFRDMRGRFTRFGPVTELLLEEDDRYVVMNAGDELTVRFDAARLPPLPSGWRRDWVVYSDGWVKDGDLHTTESRSVAPLPYHGMSAYPDRPTHRYPDSARHRQYLLDYQTREVSDEPFRRRLRRGSALEQGIQ